MGRQRPAIQKTEKKLQRRKGKEYRAVVGMNNEGEGGTGKGINPKLDAGGNVHKATIGKRLQKNEA